jgi:putative ABC transport system permease protein
VAAMLAGIVPALRAAQLNPAHALKNAGPTISAGRSDRRLLRGVAAFQTALSLALLAGAGLLVRTVENLTKVASGYSTGNILTMNVTEVQNQWMDFHERALARVAGLPAVKSASFAWGVPLTGNKWTSTVELDGQERTTKLNARIRLPTRSVTPDYFETVGLRITSGRGFRSTDAWRKDDDVTNVPPAIIINTAMAERYFPNSFPIGKKIRFPGARHASGEIVGVVSNARNESLTLAPEPEIYRSFWQFGPFSKHLVVRTAGDPHQLAGVIQRELRSIDPTVAIENVKTLEQIRSVSIAPQTFALRLLIGFSALAFVLALIGIYGVLSLSVSSRKREMAIRAAVGAQRRHFLALVLGEGFRLVLLGLVLGMVAAMAMARVLRAFLFGVEPTDPFTLIAVALFFGAGALSACWLPAWRATKADPSALLRYD